MKTWNVMIADATTGWNWIGTVEAETRERALSLGRDMAARDGADRRMLSIDVDQDMTVLGRDVQVDGSGVGQGWRDVTDDTLPPTIREEIECQIEDGKRDECDGWRASNGLIYRWC